MLKCKKNTCTAILNKEILPPERSNNSLSFFSLIIRWKGQIGMPTGPERGPQPKNSIIYLKLVKLRALLALYKWKHYGGLTRMSLYVTWGVNRCFD